MGNENQDELARLQTLVRERDEEIARLQALVLALSEQVRALEARLNMNSRNSSLPPSSDGYKKPAPKSRRTRTGNKPGKQSGDPGHHLAQRTDPDATEIHRPSTCASCGNDLSDAEVTATVRRQVFDLPPVALFCTEHRAERRRCRCGTETTGTFPPEATAFSCYGPALRAYVCYLVTRQHLPVARVGELLRDAYEAPVSTGVIVSMVKEGAALLEDFLAQLKELLCASKVVHADETGLRVEAALAWVHSVSSSDLTLYHLDQRRGNKAMDAMGVLDQLSGVLVHDGWMPYRKYDNVTHVLCNAHHLRELEAVAESEGQSWAADMIALLTDTWALVLEAKTHGASALSDATLIETRANYCQIIAAGHRANPAAIPTGRRGRPKRSKAANLLLRLDHYTDDVLRFASDFSVPFDNNLAERDIRMVKIAQKISGGFRSAEGAKAFLALRSYLSTATKQGINLFDALQQLYNQNPWMPAVPGTDP